MSHEARARRLVKPLRQFCARTARRTENVLGRRPGWVFTVALLYLLGAHVLFLGFESYDGFGFRVAPVTELVQRGEYRGDLWSDPLLRYAEPRLEIFHVPALAIMGLPGLLFGFPLLLFPLACAGVCHFMRTVTGRDDVASYGVLAFVSVPFVNTQPFAGYIDFAVMGALALYLARTLVVLRAAAPGWRHWASFGIAALIYSHVRQHSLYVSVVLFGMVATWHAVRGWSPGEPRRARLHRVGLALGVLAIALLPSCYDHWARWRDHGTPMFPYQFEFGPWRSAAGFPLSQVKAWAGLEDSSAASVWNAFRASWVFAPAMPGGFFDSRLQGAGVSLWLAAACLPWFLRAGGHVIVTASLLVASAVVVGDFWLPRFSSSMMLAVILMISVAARQFRRGGRRWLFVALLAVLGAQLLARPLYTIAGTRCGWLYSFRANLAASPFFVDEGTRVVPVYPDLGADLAVVEPVHDGFVVPLYGSRLTNRIVWVHRHGQPVAASTYRDLLELDRRSPRPLVVVDQDGRVATALGLRPLMGFPDVLGLYGLLP